jgi:hypothetical protein
LNKELAMAAALRTQKKTTVVNAAFLQEVKDSNEELLIVLKQLRLIELGKAETKTCCKQLVDCLSELRDCVGLQFSLEETYGFITAACESKAAALLNAEEARQQHRELYLQLHELCEQAEEAQYRGTIGRDLNTYLLAFQRFDECFESHEQLEADLIRDGLGNSAI